MEQYKLEISEQGRENIEETIATLIEAAQEIANLSEKDFNKVKSKKWYKRLWDVITCYKDNQKLTARGVANLAKLNEIVMKAIVILARYSADTAALVSESLQKIENLEDYLGQMTSGLSKVALEVKKLKYNYKKSLTISDLNVQERDIVGSIFVKYVKKCLAEGKMPTVASQKLYSFAMEGDTPEEDIDISTHLSLLNNDVQQLLFRLNQSYYYLVAGKFDDSDYFDDFFVSNKCKNVILSQIEDAVLFSGAENYTDTLVPNEEVYFIDSDDVEFEEKEGNESNIEAKDTAYEEISIDEKITIKKGETLEYKNKKISVNSQIDCFGTLQFNNCIVYYNSADASIVLNEYSRFSAERCIFEYKGEGNRFFILTDSYCIVKFNSCIFNNCACFLSVYSRFLEQSKVEIQNSTINNCGPDFIKAFCEVTFDNINISQERITDFGNGDNKENKKNIVLIFGHPLKITNAKVFYSEDFSCECESLSLFSSYGDYSIVADSVFENVKGQIANVSSMINCTFKNCFGDSRFGKYDILPIVVNKELINCIFENCICDDDNVLVCCKGKISDCKFISCKNTILEYYGTILGWDDEGDLTIENTSFIDCTSDNWMLSLSNNGHYTYLINCIFDNCISEYPLVNCSCLGNPYGRYTEMKKCKFINCKSKYNGKLVDGNDHWYGAFNRTHDVNLLKIIECEGV